ncbi:MAG: 4-hydroxythreonine-4-phosphate dehydrogenase PdxA [Phenylobacterium sp.]
MVRPLAVSLGDPAGIGPEIIACAWRDRTPSDRPFVVYGDVRSLSETGTPVQRIVGPQQASEIWPSAIPVVDIPLSSPVRAGHPSPAAATRITEWIEAATRACLTGEALALVTAPISKAVLKAAGFQHPGHTEFLGALTAHIGGPEVRGPVMMLAAADLKVSLATIHLPLAKVAEALTLEGLLRTTRVTARALETDFGLSRPRLALAGLNPHAGESGEIGTEEIHVIRPVVERLRLDGLDVEGPIPADSLFASGIRQRYDAIVCMYHDQALIPIKMLDFWGGVNVTIGLPVIRTSPDHGTAFDIAGKGLSRADSFIAALRMAGEIAGRRSP